MGDVGRSNTSRHQVYSRDPYGGGEQKGKKSRQDFSQFWWNVLLPPRTILYVDKVHLCHYLRLYPSVIFLHKFLFIFLTRNFFFFFQSRFLRGTFGWGVFIYLFYVRNKFIWCFVVWVPFLYLVKVVLREKYLVFGWTRDDTPVLVLVSLFSSPDRFSHNPYRVSVRSFSEGVPRPNLVQILPAEFGRSTYPGLYFYISIIGTGDCTYQVPPEDTTPVRSELLPLCKIL